MKEFKSTSAFNQAGLSLLEILIAITLLAFVTLGVVSITDNAFFTKERTTELNKNNLQIETAMSRFEWDFLQVYSPLYFSNVWKVGPSNVAKNDANGVPIPDAHIKIDQSAVEYDQYNSSRFGRNEHFITVSQEGMPIPRFYAPEKFIFEFFTTSNRRKVQNTKQSHFAWVRYSLETPDAKEEEKKAEDKNNQAEIPSNLKNLVRFFAVDDPFSEKRIDPDSGKVKGAVLLENVESLEFQFWDPNRRKWETSLRSIQGGESLLRGVKIIISWYDSSGLKRTIERTFRNHWPIFIPDNANLNQRKKPNNDGQPPDNQDNDT